MNCVILIPNLFNETEVINPIFSLVNKINMLASTIHIIRKKIPNSYISIYECIKSPIKLNKIVLDNTLVKNYYTSTNIHNDYISLIKPIVDNLDIHYVETMSQYIPLLCIYNYLKSENFINILQSIETITFIFNGLSLTESFEFNEWPLSSNIIQYNNDTFNTSFFRINRKYLPNFFSKLDKVIKNNDNTLSIGDLFLKHEVFTLENTIHDIPKLNLSGWNDTTGAYFEV